MYRKLKKSFISPLGASRVEGGWNFAVFSDNPVTLCLGKSPTDFEEIEMEKTGSIFHVMIETEALELYYGYRIKNLLLVDPYAKLLKTGTTFGENRWKRATSELLAVTSLASHFDWEGSQPLGLPRKEWIIYEMHVRGFTQDPTSQVKSPGTFKGLQEKLPYLQSLGVNTIELLPIYEFDETAYKGINPKNEAPLYNYWGYSSNSFFAPMQRYGENDVVQELKELIRACHKAKIQVILDVVYNHTAEGDKEGETFSWKGFSESYYMFDAKKKFLNFSGCGNTLNCNHPIVQDMIIDSLRYWYTEYHIDGFRFDLASILTRSPQGAPLFPAPLISRITEDPLLKNCALIAEPWDAAGLYQVGNFYKYNPARWCEWNDDYRTTVRRFMRGDRNCSGHFATKISGSQDFYNDGAPLNSLNFVTSHDGFSLYDLVSYNMKHNLENGEDNRDGMNNNDSWNSGVEGHTQDATVLQLRKRQMKNFLLALFISQGCPMLKMGDEYGHTKEGNNNSWCQDNRLSWFQWDQAIQYESQIAFVRELILLRKKYTQLSHAHFLQRKDVDWHGKEPFHPNWNDDSLLVAYTLHNLYIAFNASHEEITLTLPPNKVWQLLLKTFDTELPAGERITLPAHSSIILESIV